MTITTKVAPFGLKPWFSERVWGKKSLQPWYDETGTTELVGEAWLTGPQCVVEGGPFAGKTLASVAEKMGGEFPLLVKILFPADKLSVQVHPDDAQAKALGETRGKTECWYVLEAEPGATVALGLKPGVGAKQVAASVDSGTMESLMQHVPVSVGDMLYVDAGTVHAIGPGVVLLETQQTSDVTYRLYDYGRPRELHLEKGLQVMKSETKAGKIAPREMDGFTRLIEQKYFVVDRFEFGAASHGAVSFEGPGCLVGLAGSGAVKTAGGDLALSPGRAIVVPAGDGSVVVETNSGVSFARCVAPV
ncbi:type I phosphomannose isomerase catalytic subunit [Granulicella sp. S190]|uniref:type I phosphomannose isomerase catalytic subunit n=1 Tax=Granulicella sp. S190 TaxID=1747226 RepID=UPI00131AAFBA|nr:type I phosphomannose isomerase catalytic subunit [Granulicella sp. S190]